jgi:hypothetical protein
MTQSTEAKPGDHGRPKYFQAILWCLYAAFNLSLFIVAIHNGDEDWAAMIGFGLFVSIVFPFSAWLGWLSWCGRPLPRFLAEAVRKGRASSARGSLNARGIIFAWVFLFTLISQGVRILRKR